MPILKEYKCLDCGNHFETWDSDPCCPSCSSDNEERAFLTAPGIKSKQTTFKDTTLKQLASDYGLSNIDNKYGQAVKRGGGGATFGEAAPQSMPVMQRLQSLGAAADGFSSVKPMLQHPNAIAASKGFPFGNRSRLAK